MPEIHWFEKSVEYKYVVEKLYKGKTYPFSGNLEKWFGDAINIDETQIKLIEFKRCELNRKDENVKFCRSKGASDYRLLKPHALKSIGREIGDEFDGHYFIYGDKDQTNMTKGPISDHEYFKGFSISQCNYWNWDISGSCDPQNMEGSINCDILIDYFNFLHKFRSSDTEEAQGKGSVEIIHDKYFAMISRKEYIHLHKLYRNYDRKPKNSTPIENHAGRSLSGGR